jgi:hypothetical protein
MMTASGTATAIGWRLAKKRTRVIMPGVGKASSFRAALDLLSVMAISLF